MELRETIEDINEKLVKEFGREIDGRPRFRIVFSNDQFEKRLTDCTDEGFELMEPEVRLLPKYRQWIRDKYILERLVPIIGESDLIEKTSYEPAWVFQDKFGNYLPPFFDGCKMVIEALFAAMGRKDCFTKYKDKNISREEHLEHLQKVEDELFGNETPVGDALAYGSGVVVPESKLVH